MAYERMQTVERDKNKKDRIQQESDLNDLYKMPAVGLEPTLVAPQQILSLPRLPFRHAALERLLIISMN